MNNEFGIAVSGFATTEGSLNVTIADSVASNSFFGVFALSSSGEPVHAAVMVRNSVASNNDIGLEADYSAILRVAHSVVTGNSFGLYKNGGTVFSYGDNDIDGNTTDNTTLLTPLAMH